MKIRTLILLWLLCPLALKAEAPPSLPGEPYAFAPSRGTIRLLVLLIAFPEQTPSFTPAQFEELFFSRGQYATGSLADYLDENSYGQLKVEGTVKGWFLAKQPQDYYAAGAYGHKPELYPKSMAGLVEEAVELAEAEGVDFSQYDNNGDGQVDGLVVIHQGPGGDVTNRPEHLWTTTDYLSRDRGTALVLDGVAVDRFMLCEEYLERDQILPLGIIAHEFGHMLGLPDFYQHGSKLALAGIYDVMSAGVWGRGNAARPFSFSAWSKSRLGWLEPRLITSPESATLSPIESKPEAVRLNTPRPGEYFLLEHRAQTGFDQNLPGHGLLVWHVDENVIFGNDFSCLGCCPRHPLLALVQADGKNDIERGRNRGDPDDFFPGAVGTHPVLAQDTGSGQGRSQGAHSLSWACDLTGVRVSGIRLTEDQVRFQARTDDPGLLYTASPWITVRRIEIEEVKGDGDGRAEPGEQVRLHPVLFNQGSRGRGLALTVAAEGLRFSTTKIKQAVLPPRQEIRTGSGFLLEIPADYPAPRVVDLRLTIAGRRANYQVERRAPLLIGTPELLLLADSGPGLASLWKDVLDNLKEPVELWDPAAEGFPSPAQIQEHGIVIWVVGPGGGPAEARFSVERQEAVKQYLAAGGNLLLVAPGRSLVGAEAFAEAALHLRLGAAAGGIYRIQGREGDLISRGQAYAFQELFAYPSMSVYSELWPGEQAKVIYTDAFGHGVGVRYPAERPGPCKTVALSFNFEALPFSAQARILARILDFFRLSVDGPVADHISPNHGMRGVSGFKVTLTGLNLRPEVAVNLGAGVQVDEVRNLGPESLELSLHIDSNASVGPRDLTLSLPGRKPFILPQSFTIIP